MKTTEVAKKGDCVLSKNLNPQTDWIVTHVDKRKITVKDKSNPSDKQSLMHGTYSVAQSYN